MKKFSSGFLLFCIVALAFFLRVWRVSEIPPSLSWDEASIGYNAYSILKTARDEHGRFLPLDTFAAFGDYKPPLSIYATVPFVWLVGLNEFAVRLPSVFAGALAVVLAYFLTYELLKKTDIALLTSLILALSPWHIQLSRGGFEGNIALTLVLWGAVLLLQARKKHRLLFVCFLPFVGAMYTFNSARFAAPLFIIALVVFCWKEIRAHIRFAFFGIVIAALATLPILPHLLSAQSRLRFAEVNIFSDSEIVVTANKRMVLDDQAWWSKILHNRRVGYARSFLIHFFDNLEPRFLFIRGDGNPKFSLQDVGELYLIELPFVIFGLLYLFRFKKSVALLSVFWIISAILPAATARETPHALRIENSLPMWQLFVATGISWLLAIQARGKRLLWIIGIVLCYIVSVGYFWHNYFHHYAAEFSGEWQYGYKTAVQYATSVKYQYQSVVIDDIIGRPYIYALFYEAFDPTKFQESANRSVDGAGFYHVFGFDQYRFVDRVLGGFGKQTLYILRPQLVPKNAHVLETIRLLNGDPALVIFDIVPETKTL